jgi:uncharacterized membrane protein YhaH (DUF805 family)
MRKAVFHLVLAIVVLHGVALSIYYLAGIERGSTQTRQIFTVLWLVATAITVAILLKRVRRLRDRR